MPTIWFVLAFVPMVASQIVRLYQHEAAAWLACDYAGRLGALALLAAIPRARSVAFARARLRVGTPEAVAWAAALAVGFYVFGRYWNSTIGPHVPIHALGGTPHPKGWLLWFDATIGIALVAFHEEVMFRRCARDVLGGWLGDGIAMIAVAALLFAAYHWWTGLSNMIRVAVFGLAAMAIYRRAGALWPVVAAHYAYDLVHFYIRV